MVERAQDPWARWVLERRNAQARGDFRDRVLANVDVRAGDVLLDVGTGDGLIGFGALPLAGPSGKVIFSDISEELLTTRSVLIYVEDKGRAFREFFRVLRPGGPRPWTAGSSWEEFLETAGNPRLPPFGEVLAEALDAGECERFAAHLRALLERGVGEGRLALAYLWATKEPA
jgi:ubiquinone/menaquinone biosynthesis C-methylase UbiE